MNNQSELDEKRDAAGPSVEEMCRRLLRAAFGDGCARPWRSDDDPDELTAGDLSGMANLLNEYLSGNNKLPPGK